MLAIADPRWLCVYFIAGIAGSNTTEGIDVRLLVFVVRCDLCDELIIHPEGKTN